MGLPVHRFVESPRANGDGYQLAVVQVHADLPVLCPLLVRGISGIYVCQEFFEMRNAFATGLPENPPCVSEGGVRLKRDQKVYSSSLGRDTGVIEPDSDGGPQHHQRSE